MRSLIPPCPLRNRQQITGVHWPVRGVRGFEDQYPACVVESSLLVVGEGIWGGLNLLAES